MEFQSTLPARGATALERAEPATACNFNPRSPHGERRIPTEEMADPDGISIHAPRTGSDRERRRKNRQHDISIHAPRTGSDAGAEMKYQRDVFQSTLPARGATRVVCRECAVLRGISIHAPRTGSDASARRAPGNSCAFQSTLPARGATGQMLRQWRRIVISIHAPRTGSDLPLATTKPIRRNFNPRSPHGERRMSPVGATESKYFNPRSPHGERRFCPANNFPHGTFQSTLPARGATFSSTHYRRF